MKIISTDFLLGRAKINAAKDVQASFDAFKASIAKLAKNASKVYLNEFGNEVHVNGPTVAILKTETLREKIERLDRLAATVRANRAAMAQVYSDLGVVGVDRNGNPVVEEEDPTDFSLLDDVEIKDEFGEPIEKPIVAEPKTASQSDAANDAGRPTLDDESGGPAEPSGMPSDTEGGD